MIVFLSKAVLDQIQIHETATKEIERIAQITDTSLSTAGALLRAFQYVENRVRVIKKRRNEIHGGGGLESPSK